MFFLNLKNRKSLQARQSFFSYCMLQETPPSQHELIHILGKNNETFCFEPHGIPVKCL